MGPSRPQGSDPSSTQQTRDDLELDPSHFFESVLKDQLCVRLGNGLYRRDVKI
jgi:hypothetical protein